MALGNLAGLYGILEGISAGTDIQRQQQELRQRQQLFQQEQAQQRLQGQALAGLLQRGGAQGGGIGQPQPMIPPAPLPQTLPSPTAQSLPLAGTGGGQLASDVQRGPSGQLTMGGQPPTGMLPGGIPAWDQSRNVRGSWFGNAPGWRDPSDSGLQASGQPVSAGPGIALPADLPGGRSSTLGQQFDVTAPSGKTLTLPQTDVGPAARTGRGVDVNAPAAQAFGYTPQNFPTDQMFRVALHRDATQAGMAALQSGWPQPAAREVVQTGQATINELDPTKFGVYSLPQISQAVEKAAGPDTDPAVKAMAIGGLMKLLQPQDQMMYRAIMQQNQMALKAGLTEYVQSEIDKRTRSGQSFREQQTQFVQSEQDRRAQERTQARGGGGAAAQPSESAVDFWVKVLQQGGSLPPNIGRGRAGQALVTAVMDRVGQAGTDPGDFISAQATRKADASSLQKATAMSDAAIGFEETALKNLEIATKQLHDVAPTDLGPAINKWIETGEQALGDPSVPASVTSVLTFANEYAKVMSGATGGQGATVDARREAAQLFNPYFSTGQWDRVKAIATADMSNRKAALTENIARIKSRLSGKPAATEASSRQPEAAQTRQQADTQPVPDSLKNEDDGVTIRNKGDGSLWIKRGNQLIRAPSGAEPTPPASAGAGLGQP